MAALLSRPGEWQSRRFLADLLFRRADADAAFRQCLSRTRRWLGDGAIELRPGQVRISPVVHLDLALEDGGVAEGALILPGQSHPACQLLRDRWSRAESEGPKDHAERVRNIVWSLAELSPEDARVLLVGSPTLRHELHVTEVRRLADALRPSDRRETGARALLELLGWTCYASGAVVESLPYYRQFTRIARHEKDVNGIAAGQALEIFSLIESGQVPLAWDRFRSMVAPERAPSARLLMRNAEVALLWNSGRMEEAVDALDRAEALIQASPAWDRLHFWSNAAVFCAEHGQMERASQFVDLVAGHDQVRTNRYVQMVLGLAEATWLAGEDPARAIRLIEAEEHTAESRGWNLAVLYQRDIRALALRRLGRLEEAARVWESAERRRRALGMRLTPRLLMRKAKVMGMGTT